MLQALSMEATTWLGYLQRGSVLIQIAMFVAVVTTERRVLRLVPSRIPENLAQLPPRPANIFLLNYYYF